MYAITYLPLKNIVFSESNPRKQIDADELQELSLSISQQGILQPVLVRPQGKKYELICGARRTHAASLAKLKEIPAIIRDMTDEEAFEAQITENLQRKDVHPLEESDAYARLMDKMNLSPHQIAEKLGKQITYIVQRLKLIDLIEPFKDIYIKDVIGLGHALEICKLKPEEQEELYNNKFENRYNWWSCPTVKSLKDDIYRAFTANLSDVIWDLSDDTILPDVPACNICPSNTANSLLFPDLAQPKCTNRPCFLSKKTTIIKRTIERVYTGEEDAILVHRSWDDGGFVKQLIQQGIAVNSDSGFRTIEKPEEPDPEEYELDDPDGQEEFKADNIMYAEQLAEYEEKAKSGLIKKAYYISSSGELTNAIVINTNSAAISQTDGNIDTAELQQAQEKAEIRKQIEELKGKDKRNKELAFEKVNTHTLELMKDLKYSEVQGELSLQEKHGLFVAIVSFLGYSAEKELKGIVDMSYNRTKNTFQKYDDVVSLTQNPDHQAKILRLFLGNQLQMPSTALGINGQSINWAKAKAYMEIARLHFEKEIREVELQEEEKYLKKKDKIDARIEEMNSKLSK